LTQKELYFVKHICVVRICAFASACIIFFAESPEYKIADFVLVYRTNIRLSHIIVFVQNKILAQPQDFVKRPTSTL
jgi:hypothetical protein